MKHRSFFPILAVIVLGLALSPGLPSLASTAPMFAAQPAAHDLPDGVFVVRVYYHTVEEVELLAGFDVFEFNNHEQRYVLAAVDQAGLHSLWRMGFRAEVDAEETANFARLSVPLDSIPGYACYRTVEETYATAEAIVVAHPTLATWIDVGDSWEKSVGQPDGYDMMVLKLTNAAIPGPKPKLFITASIHAREYAPAELTTRFAEYLVDNYGVDADATWLLDHHEIHLMLQANPDGRKEAEAGRSWRKNTNENYCGVTSINRGADLNRNFTYQWGTGGSSSNPCDATYRGPSPGSEPETQTVQNYITAIFPDQRDTGAAPDDATGVYLDLHSYGGYVLWPWGYSTTDPPNAMQLQTYGRKFAYFNGYTPVQIADGLYVASGSTLDFAYGELGIAALSFELGTAFFQDCNTFNNTIPPNNLPALIYAAKTARTPYQTPLGPDALNLALAPAAAVIGEPATLTARIDDTRYRSGSGEPTQAIAAAEYYVDVPPWQAGAIANGMAAADGSFNSTLEDVTAAIDTAGLAPGRHIVFVRGQDANNNWGAFSAIYLTVATDCTSLSSSDVPKTITTIAGVESTLDFPDAYPITDVNLTIGSLIHSNTADLDITVRHPDGTVIELSTNNGGTGDNYSNTVFDDEATTPITAGVAPFTGRYRPEGLLAALNGKPADGTWRVRVVDDTSPYNGTLDSWSMQVCGSTADYSDLPLSYGKAWHTGGGSLRLGPTWTADTSFAAGADVDDGVTFPGNFTAGQNATVRVNVQGTPANGRWLRLWFDWNYNGVFDSDELVHNGSVLDGDNDLTVAVPASVTSAVHYRARLYDSASAPTASEAIDSASYGAAAGGEVEDDPSPTPLAVTLAEFYAQQISDYVRITWETVSELNNRGFNLFRATAAAGPYTQLNTTLIPSQSQGSSSGFVYTWQDRAELVPGVTYYYWLQDVDLSGATTLHGPVSVDYTGPTAVTLGGVSASPGLDTLGLDTLGLDTLGLDTLGLDTLRYSTHAAGAAALPWLWMVAAAGAALALGRRRR